MSLRVLDQNMLQYGPVLALPMQEGAGINLEDISGFGNDGAFGAGAAAPSWHQLPSGLEYLDFAAGDRVAIPIIPKGFPLDTRWEDVFPIAVRPHSQGVVIDGDYVYASSDTTIKKTNKAAPNWAAPLAINDHCDTDGTDLDQINSLFIYGDYIYVTSRNLGVGDDDNTTYIKRFNKATLVFVDEWQIEDGSAEGCTYHDGYWWIPHFDTARISQYNEAWVFQQDFILEGDWNQGAIWLGDDIWVSRTADHTDPVIDVYRWDGSGFTFLKSVDFIGNNGICKDGVYLWSAPMRVGNHNDVIKTIINYRGVQLDFTSEKSSIIMWVNVTSWPGGNSCIFGRNVGDTKGYRLQINANGKIAFYTFQAGAFQVSATPAADIVAGSWYAIGMTRDGASVKLFRSGVNRPDLIGVHIDPDTCACQACIGTASDGISLPLIGKATLPIVCNDRVLSDAEMLNIVNQGKHYFGYLNGNILARLLKQR